MIQKLNGRIDGKHIELERDAGLPSGTPVTVEIDRSPLSIEERRRRIEESCGVWRDDDEIAEIFEEILRERKLRPCRDVDFDAPS
jgi:hypothetical protein